MAKVQFNLLPDVKINFEKARRTKQRVMSIVLSISMVSLAVFLVLLGSSGLLQRQLISSADNDIANYSKQINAVPNLGKILTIQNQLAALPPLQAKKHIVSRLFDDLPMLLPPNAGISQLSLDSAASTLIMSGTADKVETVNTFVDTLKFTKFTTESDSKTKQSAFTTVVLSSVNRDSQKASFTINTTFAPQLFESASKVTLAVPMQLTTRSITDAPPLFTGQDTSGENSPGSNTNSGGTH